MNATIKEVAQRAKVSTATVSRVFNGSSLVSENTKQKILIAANDLHYIPNQAARSLSMNKTEAIGLLLPDLYGEFFSEVIRGVDEIVKRHKNHLLVSGSHNCREEIGAGLRMMRGRVDGVVIMSPGIDARIIDENLIRNLPVVLLNCFIDTKEHDSINVDNYGGAYSAVNHLIAHGHQSIAIIKGTEGNYDASNRFAGYHEALRRGGLPVIDNYVLSGDFTEESGYEAATRILKLQRRPTAIFASNDSMAIGAISALRESNIMIPKDIAIMGFDDIPMAQYIRPKLSTVHISIHQLGILATEHLYALLQDSVSTTGKHHIERTSLAIRESCGTHT